MSVFKFTFKLIAAVGLLFGQTATVFSEDLDTFMGSRIATAIEAGKLPGCVVCFGDSEQIQFLKAYGDKAVLPEKVAMTTDTVFDLASLTKPVATATSIMILVDRGDLQLQRTAADYWPEFGTHGKEAISLQDLLVHQSGLIADNPLSDYAEGRAKAIENIASLKLRYPIGEKFVYSDVNFIVLGELVARVGKQPFNKFADNALFTPLGMHETGFGLEKDLKQRAAPTQKRDGVWMQGEVHDPRAYRLDGVAGHAGLFSTAQDLSVYARMLLNKGEWNGQRILSATAIKTITKDYQVSRGIRGLGWDKQSPYSRNKGQHLSEQAFGHGGFTGTVLWIDPRRDLFFIFLSNRVHPDGEGSVNALAGDLLDLIVKSRLSKE